MKLINYIDINRACVSAEPEEITDYLENMSEIQQMIVAAFPGRPSSPISSHLLKRDITLEDGTVLRNAWCYNLQDVGDEETRIYEVEFIFEV